MGRRSDIDWEAIERDFRLGQFTLRQIGDKHGVSAGAISRKAEKEKWEQDLSDEVKERTRIALLLNATQQNNSEAVEFAVQTNVALIRDHRRDIREGRLLTAALMEELREISEKRDEIEAADADDLPVKRGVVLRAIALPSRATVMVNLTSALKTLIGLERQAFNLETAPAEGAQGVVERVVREIVYPAGDRDLT